MLEKSYKVMVVVATEGETSESISAILDAVRESLSGHLIITGISCQLIDKKNRRDTII